MSKNILEKARNLEKKGSSEEAIKLLEASLENNKEKKYIYYELGRLFGNLGNSEKSAKMYESSIECGDGRPETLLELARKFRESRQFDEAENAIKKIKNSNNYDILVEAVRIYREKGDIDSAKQTADKASGHSRADGEIDFELGRIYKNSGNTKKAVEYFRDGIKKGKDPEEIKDDLLNSLIELNLYSDAVKFLKKLAKTSDKTEIYLKLGRIYRDMGKITESVKSFSEALKTSGRNDKYFKNKILNETEISQKKTKIKSFPRKLSIVLTSRCNLKCIMCGVWRNPWDIPKSIVVEIKKILPYLEHIYWQGGELFFVDYFEELFDESIKFPQLRQTIPTNGLFITEKWAKKLVRGNISLMFSIDGATKKTYEHVRKGAKFEKLIKSIETLNKHRGGFKGGDGGKMFTEINFVVMRSNYHELVKIVEFAHKYSFDALMINPIRPGSNDKEDCFSKNRDKKIINKIKKLMPEVHEKANKYGILLTLCNCGVFEESFVIENNNETCSEKIDDEVKENKEKTIENDITPLICHWPWQHLFIDVGGNIKPDPYCKIDIGNVNANSIKELWNNEIMQKYRSKISDHDYTKWCSDDCIKGDSIRWSSLE